MKTYWVYLLASQRNGTLYIGVTNDLARRVQEHREGRGGAFTRRYKVRRLVWLAEFGEIEAALECETRMKRWERAWKIREIEAMNPNWDDLSLRLNG
ncbi:MAG: GIY-YIG nuclease family protein [Methylobacterium sp.]|nr:GIY-YIG nuclease family protein [Methylobacterium sp.]